MRKALALFFVLLSGFLAFTTFHAIGYAIGVDPPAFGFAGVAVCFAMAFARPYFAPRGRVAFAGLMPLPAHFNYSAIIQDKRLVLESIREKYADTGVVITDSTLRLEQSCPSGTQLINFALMESEGRQTATEKRLNRPDAFAITEIGICLGVLTSDDLEGPVVQYITGPSPAATAIGVTPLFIDLFHAGQISMVQNTVRLSTNWDNYRSRRVGTAQQGLATAFDSQDVAAEYEADAWASGGFLENLIPSQTLNGSLTNAITCEFPVPLFNGETEPVPQTVFAVLMMRGYLIAGGAKFLS